MDGVSAAKRRVKFFTGEIYVSPCGSRPTPTKSIQIANVPGASVRARPNESEEVAKGETRFQDPRGPFFEFQIDAQGKVTGAVLEQQGQQGTQKVPLERK